MAVEIQKIDLHNKKQIIHAVNILKEGGVIVYPTDTIYGLGADILNKEAILKIFQIKKVSKHKLLSLICPDFRSISDWAHVPNSAFRIMRRVLPGKYTFILPASKEAPKMILKKRHTLGIRIPDSITARLLAAELGRPILNTSVPKGEDDFFTDPQEIVERFKYDIDLILDAGMMPNIPSTVVDFTTDPPKILRKGAGDINTLF